MSRSRAWAPVRSLMQKVSFEETVERIVERDPRYGRDAYEFVREALEFTQQQVAGMEPEGQRHVSGQQLLEGIRDYALREFGPMAITLFDAWGIRKCEDFGEIVFLLIEHGILRKTDTDRREDFQGGYDFQQALVRPFLPANRLGGRVAAPAPRSEPA